MWQLCYGIFVIPAAILYALVLLERLIWGGGNDDA